jgi:putative heme-binding domain-containing protein
LEIREGFQSYLILTLDGRSLNGMIAAQDDATVTLRNAENQLTVVSRDDIDLLRALPSSLMPTDVLRDMNEQELRDLFAYLSLGTSQ